MRRVNFNLTQIRRITHYQSKRKPFLHDFSKIVFPLLASSIKVVTEVPPPITYYAPKSIDPDTQNTIRIEDKVEAKEQPVKQENNLKNINNLEKIKQDPPPINPQIISEKYLQPEEKKNPEINEAKIKREPNQKLSEKAKIRAVPATQIGRVFGFGQMAVSLLYGTIQDSLSNSLGISEDKNFLSRNKAERLVSGLSRMRGAALKLGQMLSIQGENFLPGPVQDIFDRLRQNADIMSPSQCSQVLTEAFGANWKSKFTEFDENPFAAASIGQVHYAKVNNEPVAVKIQYPGVAKSIDSDIKNLSRILKLSGMLPDGLFIEKSLKVLGEELKLETDYIREAACQQRTIELLKDMPEFYVPSVYNDHTTDQVLTTELIYGVPVETLKDHPDQALRDFICASILKLCLHEIFVFNFMQTDPNWSNFYYDTVTNKINLLDFGACREYEEEFMKEYRNIVLSAANNDKQSVYDSSVKLGFLTGYESEIMKNAHMEAVMIIGEPFREQGEFDFVNHGTAKVRDLIPTILKHRLVPPPHQSYSLHRKLSGAFILCAKLRGKIRCRDILLETLKK